MEEKYIVYTNEDGIIFLGNKEDALSEYERQKKGYYITKDDGFWSENDAVFVARVEKIFASAGKNNYAEIEYEER